MDCTPVRLTLASRLGHDIDGAWWPRTPGITRELPDLIGLLGTRLGDILDITVNWSSSQGPPKLDSYGWEAKRQHVMTITGSNGRVNLLIVPCRTGTALAVLVLRRAAGLPIDPIHLDTPVYRTADSIVRAALAQTECAASCPTQT
jgi:hypothetical protein